MTEHYYSQNPEVGHRLELIEVTLKGQPLKLYTDQGVFSKKRVDFGTRLLIETAKLPWEGTIVDVGCGYGPIGLAVAKESARRQVVMVDINRRAVELAQKNARLNDIHNVKVIESNLLEAVKGKPFDAVLTNPPIRAGKAVVFRLFEQSYDVLKEPGGVLWVVIQKKQGAPSAVKKLENLFGQVEEVEKKKGYRIIKAIKS
ncbi:16S rRNA (guanine1207-N2)-methyltransferase [Caldalkalibacillus uzonensis]|uniref:16S rRNA (Guanine1207-N2)-methyltransferase n=1 Tax=Caldalkalibacillus uzonensis TaxID=353224 RepID=A0ABU0CUT1_9BACI|nr:class I SAM-dependent methyltransferase [Caldalkalibacillus uzonensis]MDQ0340177.1 16S rRNA (guanine1207-N2)-methyltransferase [Caldalkalibacillus uzonensis]